MNMEPERVSGILYQDVLGIYVVADGEDNRFVGFPADIIQHRCEGTICVRPAMHPFAQQCDAQRGEIDPVLWILFEVAELNQVADKHGSAGLRHVQCLGHLGDG
jgi:hypothetical protein